MDKNTTLTKETAKKLTRFAKSAYNLGSELLNDSNYELADKLFDVSKDLNSMVINNYRKNEKTSKTEGKK